MIEIRDERILSHSPSDVWNALIAFEHYGRWNPQIHSLKGRGAVHETLQATVVAPFFKSLTFSFRPTITVWESEQALAWTGGVKGVLFGRHYWKLKPYKNGTKLVHGEQFTGCLSYCIPSSLQVKMQQAYEQASVSLEQYLNGTS
ncbi:polyketide cyclase/dehydrase [Fictibacillus macauensis ZFHKF-1]|uniref:Polyketide cyclase/dehydrase n=1 Tax=Fictibacillus macauensis ZFHKF-1 TaxID=1196324 RepID=I8AGF5_9BACL|nr:SRPBCC domain-containing protein [Fictibacillus macauensis]EIT84767.1 polyketide cyclase/dehydrase [Fictibacillus macauensis ZFHKF-1]